MVIPAETTNRLPGRPVERPQPKLAAAFVQAQSKLGHAMQDAENPHFRSRYASLKSVIDVCRRSLADCGLAFIQSVRTERVDDKRMHVGVATTLIHESGERMESDRIWCDAPSHPQGIGSAITYLKRYSLAAMLGIAPDDGTDDDGHTATVGQELRQKTVREGLVQLRKAAISAKTAEELEGVRVRARGWWKELDDDLRPVLRQDAETLKTEIETRLKEFEPANKSPQVQDLPTVGDLLDAGKSDENDNE